ncbi:MULTISPECIES: hypothetical protein [unclassified Microcoleus]|uniref:hypothetical protein n=1 Tax=unclassified Microcoleus TaxID=2642155 RepID=UPI002FCF5F4E
MTRFVGLEAAFPRSTINLAAIKQSSSIAFNCAIIRDYSVLVKSSHQTERGKSNANLPLSRNCQEKCYSGSQAW